MKTPSNEAQYDDIRKANDWETLSDHRRDIEGRLENKRTINIQAHLWKLSNQFKIPKPDQMYTVPTF